MVEPTPTARHTWRRAFRDIEREHGFVPLRVEGQLPRELSGTLFRVGPGLFQAQGRPYRHWFDGDGVVMAARFSAGRAEGALRLVQTAGLLREREAHRALYAAYGTPPPGGPARLILGPREAKNAANTALLLWQGRLFALWEGGPPTEIAPSDLATIGVTELEEAQVTSFSAHPRRVPDRRTTYNFGVRYGVHTDLVIYELPDGGPARELTTVRLAGRTMIHDFAATARHLVFFAPPLRMEPVKLLLGLASYDESLAFRPELGTEVVVVPLDAPDKPIRFQAEPFYQWHFANAWDDGDEVIVDFVRMPDFRSNAFLRVVHRQVPAQPWDGRLYRGRLSLRERRATFEQQWGVPVEFPQVNPEVAARHHRYVHCGAWSPGDATRGLSDRLARVDMQTGEARVLVLGEEQYPSEVTVVPRATARGEDDAWLLSQVYDGLADETHVAVLDAARPEEGPVARCWFDHAVPITFHGTFMP